MRRSICGVIAVALACILAQATYASPVDFGSLTGTVLASTGAVSFSLNTGAITGKVQEDVVLNGGGTLDFVYQLKNVSSTSTPADVLELLTGASFNPFFVAIGIADSLNGNPSLDASVFTGTLLAPDSVNESLAGVANFHYDNTGLGVGQSSTLLVVRTSATTFGGGSIFIQDGGNTTVAGFAPAPLPSVAGVGTLLLGGLGGFGRRNRRRNMIA